MKKLLRNLSLAFAAVMVSLAMFGCGGSEAPVNYDGTYRCYSEGSYYFLVIKSDDMTMYFGATDSFAQATALDDGTFKLTVRDDEGITAVSETFGSETVYSATTSDGSPALFNETKNRTYVKI